MKLSVIALILIVTSPWSDTYAQDSMGSTTSPAKAMKEGEGEKPKRGSLWQRGPQRRVLLRKSKNRPPIRKHDIILVVVSENDSASNDARLDTQRRLQLEQTIDAFIRFSGHKLKPDFSPQPEIEIENQRRLQANGSTDRRDNVRLRVAARVVDVRGNGNLIIEASEEKTINAETTKVVLTGEIRTADVGDDYSISSDRVASMKLHYHGSGPISRNAGETWLTRIVDFIWPF